MIDFTWRPRGLIGSLLILLTAGATGSISDAGTAAAGVPERVLFVASSPVAGQTALVVLDTAHKTTTTVFAANGEIRDPDVSFDGGSIVFAMREHNGLFHLYRIGADGSGLTQLTGAPGSDDTNPVFLPDGGIAFVSTRATIRGPGGTLAHHLYRMGADGADIVRIGSASADESDPAVLTDGRIIYTRTERPPFIPATVTRLWTMYPDGTNQSLYWGETIPTTGTPFSPHPIPGTATVLCLMTPADGEHAVAAVIDRSTGIQDSRSVVDHIELGISPASSTAGMGAIPCAGGGILYAGQVSGGGTIRFIDRPDGDRELYSSSGECRYPVPLVSRATPPAIPPWRNYDKPGGWFYVQNVYLGAPMQDGSSEPVRWLRVVALEDDPFGGAGDTNSPPAMGHGVSTALTILGTVPVADDSSAFFAAPGDTAVFFQLLDADGRLIQSMRGSVLAQPGEYYGCIGCHESRLIAPPPTGTKTAAAFARDPDALENRRGESLRPFDFARDVQPVLDAACVRCHDVASATDGRPVLTGDRTSGEYSRAYESLARAELTALPDQLTTETPPPGSWGSSASLLIAMLRAGHQGVAPDTAGIGTIAVWIDLGAPFFGSYRDAYAGSDGTLAPAFSDALSQHEQAMESERLNRDAVRTGGVIYESH